MTTNDRKKSFQAVRVFVRRAATAAMLVLGLLSVERTQAQAQGYNDPEIDYIIRFDSGTLNDARSGGKDRLFFYTFGFRAQFGVDGSAAVNVSEHDERIKVKEGDAFEIPSTMGSKSFWRVPHFRASQSPRVTVIGAVIVGVEGRGCTRNTLHKKVIRPAKAALQDAIEAMIADQPVPFGAAAEAWFTSASSDLLAVSSTFSQRIRTREMAGGCLGAAMVPGVKKPILTGFHMVMVLPNDHPVSSTVNAIREDFEAPFHPALTVKVVDFSEAPESFPIGPIQFTGGGEIDMDIRGEIRRLDLTSVLPPGVTITVD